MTQKLEKLGISSEALDELVYEAASSMASRVNNGGMSEQLSFLSSAGVSEDQVIREILPDILKPGMAVDVDNPQRSDSTHNCAFSGWIESISEDYVSVRDMEDNVWDVFFSEGVIKRQTCSGWLR